MPQTEIFDLEDEEEHGGRHTRQPSMARKAPLPRPVVTDETSDRRSNLVGAMTAAPKGATSGAAVVRSREEAAELDGSGSGSSSDGAASSSSEGAASARRGSNAGSKACWSDKLLAREQADALFAEVHLLCGDVRGAVGQPRDRGGQPESTRSASNAEAEGAAPRQASGILRPKRRGGRVGGGPARGTPANPSRDHSGAIGGGGWSFLEAGGILDGGGQKVMRRPAEDTEQPASGSFGDFHGVFIREQGVGDTVTDSDSDSGRRTTNDVRLLDNHVPSTSSPTPSEAGSTAAVPARESFFPENDHLHVFEEAGGVPCTTLLPHELSAPSSAPAKTEQLPRRPTRTNSQRSFSPRPPLAPADEVVLPAIEGVEDQDRVGAWFAQDDEVGGADAKAQLKEGGSVLPQKTFFSTTTPAIKPKAKAMAAPPSPLAERQHERDADGVSLPTLESLPSLDSSTSGAKASGSRGRGLLGSVGGAVRAAASRVRSASPGLGSLRSLSPAKFIGGRSSSARVVPVTSDSVRDGPPTEFLGVVSSPGAASTTPLAEKENESVVGAQTQQACDELATLMARMDVEDGVVQPEAKEEAAVPPAGPRPATTAGEAANSVNCDSHLQACAAGTRLLTSSALSQLPDQVSEGIRASYYLNNREHPAFVHGVQAEEERRRAGTAGTGGSVCSEESMVDVEPLHSPSVLPRAGTTENLILTRSASPAACVADRISRIEANVKAKSLGEREKPHSRNKEALVATCSGASCNKSKSTIVEGEAASAHAQTPGPEGREVRTGEAVAGGIECNPVQLHRQGRSATGEDRANATQVIDTVAGLISSFGCSVRIPLVPVRGLGAGTRMTRDDLEAVAEQVERMEQVEWVQEIPELEESGDDLQQAEMHQAEMLEILCAHYGIPQGQGGPPTTAAQALGLVENLFDYSDTTTESCDTLSDLSGFSTGSAKAAELLNEVRQLQLRAIEQRKKSVAFAPDPEVDRPCMDSAVYGEKVDHRQVRRCMDSAHTPTSRCEEAGGGCLQLLRDTGFTEDGKPWERCTLAVCPDVIGATINLSPRWEMQKKKELAT
eukprot:g9398.t1